MWFVDQSGDLINSDRFFYFFIRTDPGGEFVVVGRCEFSAGEVFVEVAKFDSRKDAESYLARLGRFLDARNVVGNVRVNRVAGEDIAGGMHWIDRDWAGEFQVVLRRHGCDEGHLARGIAMEDIMKGQRCWFDPSDGRLFLEKDNV